MIPPKKRLLQEQFNQNQREQKIDARLNADNRVTLWRLCGKYRF